MTRFSQNIDTPGNVMDTSSTVQHAVSLSPASASPGGGRFQWIFRGAGECTEFWLGRDQRFFMANAQIWRGKSREDALRNQILSNPHAPDAARGSIPVRNIDAWYNTFAVKEGDKAYIKPEERVKIW